MYFFILFAQNQSRFFSIQATKSMMISKILHRALSLLPLLPICHAQFPLEPEGVTVLESKFGDGVEISYKEVCNSTSSTTASADSSCRPISVKQHQASNHILDTSIYHQVHCKTLEKSKLIQSILSFGSSKPVMIPPMLLFLSG